MFRGSRLWALRVIRVYLRFPIRNSYLKRSKYCLETGSRSLWAGQVMFQLQV